MGSFANGAHGCVCSSISSVPGMSVVEHSPLTSTRGAKNSDQCDAVMRVEYNLVRIPCSHHSHDGNEPLLRSALLRRRPQIVERDPAFVDSNRDVMRIGLEKEVRARDEDHSNEATHCAAWDRINKNPHKDRRPDVHSRPASSSLRESGSLRRVYPETPVNSGARNVRTVASDSERYCRE